MSPPLTKLERALMGTALSPAEREAVFACVSVAYDDCPEEVAAVMEPLMQSETGTRAERLIAAGIEHSPLVRALDEARERCFCPYLALKAGTEDGKVKGSMMLATRGGQGTLLRPFTLDLTEEEAVVWLETLTNEVCVANLRSIAAKEPAGANRGALLGAAELTAKRSHT